MTDITTHNTDTDLVIFRSKAGGFGLYRPDEDVIETYMGDERYEIPGSNKGEDWEEVAVEDLHESIEEDIEAVESDIDDLRDRELTEAQEQELNRLEFRLESRRNLFETLKEVAQDGE